MSKVYSLDKHLNKEIKNILHSYSTRVLTGGLQLKPTTINKWLNTVQTLPAKAFCIGTSITGTFDHLKCSQELSNEGVINLETRLRLETNTVYFEITSNLTLASDKAIWVNDVTFDPYKIHLITLPYKDLKEMTPVLKHFKGDILLASLHDIIIRDVSDKAFDPVQNDQDIFTFVNHQNTQNRYLQNMVTQSNNINVHQPANPQPTTPNKDNAKAPPTPYTNNFTQKRATGTRPKLVQLSKKLKDSSRDITNTLIDLNIRSKPNHSSKKSPSVTFTTPKQPIAPITTYGAPSLSPFTAIANQSSPFTAIANQSSLSDTSFHGWPTPQLMPKTGYNLLTQGEKSDSSNKSGSPKLLNNISNINLIDNDMEKQQRIKLQSHLANLEFTLEQQQLKITNLETITTQQSKELNTRDYQMEIFMSILNSKFFPQLTCGKIHLEPTECA